MRTLQRTWGVSTVLSLLLLGGCGSNSAPPPSPPKIVPEFAYVTGDGPTSVSTFAVDVNKGSLTSVTGSPFSSDQNILSLSLHPNGKFLYTLTRTDSAYIGYYGAFIGGYSVDSNSGALTTVAGSPFSLWGVGEANASAMAVDSSGGYLYVSHWFESHLFYGGHINVYAIDKNTGAVSPGTGLEFPAGQEPVSISQDSSGKFLYVGDNFDGQLLAYSIDRGSGSLSPVAGSPFPCPSPWSVVADPKGDFVFAINHSDNTISAYAIDTGSGALSAVSGSPFAGDGDSPRRLTVDPTGSFLYVANTASVSGYRIDGSGRLTAVSGSPFSVGESLAGIAVDPAGKFVYVTDSLLKQLFGFTIGSEGSLTALASSPFEFTAGSPNDIVVFQSSQ